MQSSPSICISEQLCDIEEQVLSTFAAKSRNNSGRKRPEEKCPVRTEFQRDRDRILHSKAFRRLKHKTQVFLSPVDDHYRTRMTHTLEVSQIARTIAKALRLNEDLTEAIALGHDLGHTPFGHTGEIVLNELMNQGFKHNEQSVRTVDFIEDLNLTGETLDGILNHCGQGIPYTLEGQIVKISDRIAYLNHDIDDATRAGIIAMDDLPKSATAYFANNKSSRIRPMVIDIIQNSLNQPSIKISEECLGMMTELRSWMFKHVYIGSPAKAEEDKARKVVEHLFEYYVEAIKSTPDVDIENEELVQRTVVDYIAGMTDRYAVSKFKEIFIPAPMNFKSNDDFLFKLAEKNNIVKNK